ncbi:MAG TPA: transglycosylase SLT domain-containing protein [Dissulfurispiraceae bacterium]|nr:transglycosylase SLT domain-containing protein [Dissulfurispiraceae bacterium]
MQMKSFIGIFVCILLSFPGHSLCAQADSKENIPSRPGAAVALYEGKLALDTGMNDRAVAQLTEALAGLPSLTDYALFWRAKAYLALGDVDHALQDIRRGQAYRKDSPLLRQMKLIEIECAKKGESPELDDLMSRYLSEYPTDAAIKYTYALHLKSQGKNSSAQKLFRDLYTTVTPFARAAAGELKGEITAENMLVKAKNLNAAWYFPEAEQYFRDTVAINPRLRASAEPGLAYALFRQKKYPDAAVLYGKLGNTYWHARSLLRANRLEAFEEKIDALLRLRESRTGALLLSYATKKRRLGDPDAAVLMYEKVASRYPSEREEAQWLIGWTSYRQKDFGKAAAQFSRLASVYGSPKYQYWRQRAEEQTDEGTVSRSPSGLDFYGFLAGVRRTIPLPGISYGDPDTRRYVTERTETLKGLGFKQEASAEFQALASRVSSHDKLIAISEELRRTGDYKQSMLTAVKVPYSPDIHDLYYPMAYRGEIEDAAARTGLDPYLLLAVIREESRFASDARSIAGALGLMQLMPETAKRIASEIDTPFRGNESLTHPKTNVVLGAAYLSRLIGEFGGIPYAVAAYNAGEEAVRDWVRNGSYASVDEFIEDIPYYETQNYVKKVLTSYFHYLRMQGDTDIRSVQKRFGKL